MRVLYLSCFPDDTFKKKIQTGRLISQAAQKFNKLYVRGFCASGLDVDVVIFCAADEECDHYDRIEYFDGAAVNYYYHQLKGNRLERSFDKKHFAKQFMNQWSKDYPDGIVVIDALKPGALEFSKEAYRQKLRVYSIITDFVDFLEDKNASLRRKVFNFIRRAQFYKQFSYTYGFVLLTKPMLEKLKVGKRKYVVADGICDSGANITAVKSKLKSEKIVFLYSGALSRQFGLHNLVNGFIAANIENAELHLYGTGDYVEELLGVCRQCDSVKYFGTVPNEVMVQKQVEATFLVNPRPVGDEYTKYSFPSKNIEYMRSGRPLITTKLPCITRDYDQYVYYFDDDTAQGIAASLKRCSLIESTELERVGKEAQYFIISEKNNAVQAKKILNMNGSC